MVEKSQGAVGKSKIDYYSRVMKNLYISKTSSRGFGMVGLLVAVVCIVAIAGAYYSIQNTSLSRDEAGSVDTLLDFDGSAVSFSGLERAIMAVGDPVSSVQVTGSDSGPNGQYELFVNVSVLADSVSSELLKSVLATVSRNMPSEYNSVDISIWSGSGNLNLGTAATELGVREELVNDTGSLVIQKDELAGVAQGW